MGDRYILCDDCPFCGQINDNVWYAPTCGAYSKKCCKCGKTFYINSNFKFVKKLTDEEMKAGYEMCSNAIEIKELCNDMVNEDET